MTIPVFAGPAPDAPPAVAVSDLFCLYAVPTGTVAALRGLSLTVAAGERLVVHGPNGSGKTTLLRVILGELPPSAGSARLAGVDLAGADDATRSLLRRTELGVVDQHSARALRPELRVRDNVALQSRLAGTSRGQARGAADRMLERLGLTHLADRFPPQLSGGEAQRVAVCAALTHRPAVVLADEPTGELDAVAADQVYDLLAAAVADLGATLLLVTHDQRAARIADRVVRIRDGRLSEQWSPHAPADEALVVDDRGWVRLPERLRRRAGAHSAVRASGDVGQIVLHGQDEPTAPHPATAAAARTPGPVVAALERVTVAYGDRIVLAGVDLNVRASALTVVRGRSGSGKSTLLRVLTGLADVDAGRVTLAGRDLASLDRTGRADLRRREVAIASQLGSLGEPLDAVENLTLARVARGLAGDRDAVDRTVEHLGLQAVATRPVRLLSGGERQRVGVARALVAGRPLVVLDEPSSQQDEAHAELVATALAAAAGGGTAVLCATHDPVLIAAADSVLALD
jgi:ABC-type lipoprotein export system ATPase subunit